MVWRKILQKTGFGFGLPAVDNHQLHMMLLMVSSSFLLSSFLVPKRVMCSLATSEWCLKLPGARALVYT